MRAQEGEEWQQRQAEDREPVALDVVEELRPEALRLVAADAAQDAGPRPREIVVQEGIGEVPHGQPRMHHRTPYLRLVASDGDGRDEFVPAAAKPAQLRARVGHIRRLVEPLPRADEQLVGADDISAGVPRAHPAGLENGERARRRRLVPVLRPHGALDLVLVHLRRLDREGEPRRAQQRRPRFGRGSQHQPRFPRPFTGRRASVPPHAARPWKQRLRSWRIAAAVSSIERRLTSMTGQDALAKSRRASRTSSSTRSGST